MAEILFVTWDGGGNLPPALALADELQRRGHTIRVLGHAGQQARVVASGAAWVQPRHTRDFSGLDTPSTMDLLRAFGDRGQGRDVLEELDRRPADLVVVDCLCFGALAAVQSRGQRHAVLEHFHDSKLHADTRSPLALVLRLMGFRVRALLERSPLRLVATLPELDALPSGDEAWTRAVVQVGAVVPSVRPPAPDRSGQAVLISLSTFGYRGMTAVLQRLIDAAATLEVRTIVTTGPVDPGDLRVGADVEVHRFLPHAEVMPSVDLVVGHGGHGTTLQALAHGLPLLIVPMDAKTDQPTMGRCVATAGAGRTLRRTASVEQAREAMRELLAPGPHHAAAARLAHAIQAMPGAVRGADEVENLLNDSGVGSPVPPVGGS